MSKLHDLFSGKGGGQRHLKVGEEMRRILADIFLRGESNSPELFDAAITISEVRVAPDMKNATAFVMPLAGANKEKLLLALKAAQPEIRYLVSKRITLRHTPKIYFALDESFDEAQRINELLKKPEVARDLEKPVSDK